MLRAGVVAGMVAGLLTAVASPAHADHDIRIDGIGGVELQAGGGAQTITLRVENRNQGNHNSEDGVARNLTVTLTVPGELGVQIISAPNGCTARGDNTALDCVVNELAPGQAQAFPQVQIAAHGAAPVPAGENRSGTAEVVTDRGGRQTFNVRVNGPERLPSVGQVSGVVTDQNTGQPIEGATVTLADSQGADFERNTNAEGQFQFADEQIAPGRIALRARKDGFQSGGDSIHNVQANQSLNDVRLVLINSATPTPTGTPSPTPAATPTATASPVPATEPASSGRSFFTTLMIVLGVLFVALGIGAIVLLIIRQRRRAREDEEGEGLDGADDPTSGPQGPGPTPGSRGVYRPTPTQVAGAAQTQVLGPGGTALPAVGPRPALADGTAVMHRGMGADQTAMLPRAGDPPGPRPPVPGHGPGGPGTAPIPRPASPPPTTYGATPASPPPTTYGATPAGPYGDQRGGYADPRAGHGDPRAGHGDPRAGHGEPRGGYGDPRTGYDSPRAGHADQRGGYGDQRGSYPGSPAAPASGGGEYGGGDRSYGAYDQPTGRHERGGYEPDRSYRSDSYGPDPYTQPPPSSGGGYGDTAHQGYQRGGYESAGYNGASGGYNGASGGYDGASGGYDAAGYDRGGYDRGDYDSQGYQQQPGYDERGYAPAPEQGHDPRHDTRGYDQTRHYEEPPADRARPDAPPERRRLDWLD